MKLNENELFESILDDVNSSQVDVSKIVADTTKYKPYVYETELEYELADWQDNMPLVVCVELMIFEDNKKFVEYFDIFEEIVSSLRFPHKDVRAAVLKSREYELVHPTTEERVVRVNYYMPIRPTIRQFLDFLTVIASITIRANSRDDLTPTVEVYQKYEGRNYKDRPYIMETTSGAWQELLGFLFVHKVRMLPWKGGKRKFEAKIEEIANLLMKHEWFYNYQMYNHLTMFNEVKSYFEKLDVLARTNK